MSYRSSCWTCGGCEVYWSEYRQERGNLANWRV